MRAAVYGRIVFLIKLHGSIDWQWESSDRLREAPTREMEDAKKLLLDYRRRGLSAKPRSAIIFGGKNKLTAEGPFLDLLFWFRQVLQLSNELVVVGYSFRDDHVNHTILSRLRASDTNRLIVITRSRNFEHSLFFRFHLCSLGRQLTLDPIGGVDGIQRYFPAP
jgi:SIR2-like domain